MQEWRGKYEDAERVRTSPMVDGPVIFALGRTAVELFLPVPVAALLLWRFGFPALLMPMVLAWALPRMRERWGRNRLLHRWWGLGFHPAMVVTERAMALAGVRGGTKVPTPFRQGRVKRYRP